MLNYHNIGNHLNVHVATLLQKLHQWRNNGKVAEMVGIGEHQPGEVGAGQGEQKVANTLEGENPSHVQVHAQHLVGKHSAQVGHDQGAPVAALGEVLGVAEAFGHQPMENACRRNGVQA